jgi:hypothetical protein
MNEFLINQHQTIIKYCKICNKLFISNNIEKQCCSRKCSNSIGGKFNKNKKKLTKCKYCDNKILVAKNSSSTKHVCKNCFPKYFYITPKCIKRKKNCKICGSFDCSDKYCKKVRLIPNLVKYFNFNKTKIGTEEIHIEFEKIKEMLNNDYYIEKLSLFKIAEKYKHSNIGNFSKLLYALNMPFINKNIHQSYCKQGWHTTWNNKQVFYRSSYELNYAKELDLKCIDYQMENLKIQYFDTIQQKPRKAIPDFYIPLTNTIIEIKSVVTLNIQEMKDKVKAYSEQGYNFKLILEYQETDLNTL